jgi:hypothetical protein
MEQQRLEMASSEDPSHVLGLMAGISLLALLATIYWVLGKPQRSSKAAAVPIIPRSSSASSFSVDARFVQEPEPSPSMKRRRLRDDGRVQHSEEIDLRSTCRHSKIQLIFPSASPAI